MGYVPDFAMLVVGANTGIGKIDNTRDLFAQIYFRYIK